jgi:hypothetical protein
MSNEVASNALWVFGLATEFESVKQDNFYINFDNSF